jgi:hypothetical protein
MAADKQGRFTKIAVNGQPIDCDHEALHLREKRGLSHGDHHVVRDPAEHGVSAGDFL